MLDARARLKKLRGSMSQEEIALSLGIHRNTWARWESGKGEPDLTVLSKIAQKMRISLEWLIMGTGQMYQDASRSSSCGSVDAETSDSRRNEEYSYSQHAENNNKKNIDAAQNVRLSENSGQQRKERHAEKIMELQERLLFAQERIASLLEDKADLLLELERVRMDVERRERRIRDLEKENAQLREAQKGAAALQHDAAWKTG